MFSFRINPLPFCWLDPKLPLLLPKFSLEEFRLLLRNCRPLLFRPLLFEEYYCCWYWSIYPLFWLPIAKALPLGDTNKVGAPLGITGFLVPWILLGELILNRYLHWQSIWNVVLLVGGEKLHMVVVIVITGKLMMIVLMAGLHLSEHPGRVWSFGSYLIVASHEKVVDFVHSAWLKHLKT